jgi:hypothetical protein
MIAALGIGLEIGIQEIGKEENLQNHKHHKKLDDDDQPCLFSPFGHIAKSFLVKQYYFFQYFHSNRLFIQPYKVKLFSFNS